MAIQKFTVDHGAQIDKIDGEIVDVGNHVQNGRGSYNYRLHISNGLIVEIINKRPIRDQAAADSILDQTVDLGSVLKIFRSKRFNASVEEISLMSYRQLLKDKTQFAGVEVINSQNNLVFTNAI